MLLKILIVFLVVVFILAIYAFVRTPKVVTISRTQFIQASSEKLFPYINNPRLIQEWNPFIADESEVKLNYFGPSEGADSQWTWDGKKSGAGKATIIKSEMNSKVTLRLDFERPFKVTNAGEYSLAPNGSGTNVTWTIYETALIPRVLSNFMNLEKMIGGLFEKGLLKLKDLAENAKNNS